MNFLKMTLMAMSIIHIESTAIAQSHHLNEKTLKRRISQGMVERMSLEQIIKEGERLFVTPFNKQDGFGDGPVNSGGSANRSNRPTINENGSFLRVNGLDAQSCQECHSIVSVATIPPIYGVGGAGGASASAFPKVRFVDADGHNENASIAGGRMINPPFLFGAGGIELLAKEMTRDLQDLRRKAERRPGRKYELRSKGISFGFITYDGDRFDYSELHGVGTDLVVKPFGRKGDFPTVRAFDVEALKFHMGIEAVGLELEDGRFVTEHDDHDNDGVRNEVTVGELSAMHIHNVTLATPTQEFSSTARQGLEVFNRIGCNSCHVNTLTTDSKFLPVSAEEIPTAPFNNSFRELDLSGLFEKASNGGLEIPLFADLKLHDMGPELAERATIENEQDANRNQMFTTARLWGVADTAPYMHDGRATTLQEAIQLHGGEAAESRENYRRLSDREKGSVIGFLKSLKTPR